MRQRLIFVVIAVIAALAIGEVVLNLQQRSADGSGQRAAATATETSTVAAANPMLVTATPTALVMATQTVIPTAIPSTPVAYVLTARQAITEGTLILPQTVGKLFTSTPLMTPAPAGSITSLGDLAILVSPRGRLAARSLLSGDPLLLADLGYPPAARSVAGTVPPGYLAVSLMVSGARGLEGVVTVGDDVDVLAAAPLPATTTVTSTWPGTNALVRRLTTARVIALGPLEGEVTVAVMQGPAVAQLVAANELHTDLHLVLRPWSGPLPTATPFAAAPPQSGPPPPTVATVGRTP